MSLLHIEQWSYRSICDMRRLWKWWSQIPWRIDARPTATTIFGATVPGMKHEPYYAMQMGHYDYQKCSRERSAEGDFGINISSYLYRNSQYKIYGGFADLEDVFILPRSQDVHYLVIGPLIGIYLGSAGQTTSISVLSPCHATYCVCIDCPLYILQHFVADSRQTLWSI